MNKIYIYIYSKDIDLLSMLIHLQCLFMTKVNEVKFLFFFYSYLFLFLSSNDLCLSIVYSILIELKQFNVMIRTNRLELFTFN
jgi:hypothetical protein